MTEVLFFIEVVVAGLLAGTMYSLVALGFVLIYKASSTFNFAQGAMVFFAVLAFVGFMELGLPFSLAFVVTVLLMVLVGFCTERMVLNPLMNQSEDTLLMATIGLGFVLEGLAQAAKRQEVNLIILEDQFGQGMLQSLLQPYLRRIYPCTVEPARSNVQKERRIINALETEMNQHRLIVNRSVIENDSKAKDEDSVETHLAYQLFHQLTHLTVVT